MLWIWLRLLCHEYSHQKWMECFIICINFYLKKAGNQNRWRKHTCRKQMKFLACTGNQLFYIFYLDQYFHFALSNSINICVITFIGKIIIWLQWTLSINCFVFRWFCCKCANCCKQCFRVKAIKFDGYYGVRVQNKPNAWALNF